MWWMMAAQAGMSIMGGIMEGQGHMAQAKLQAHGARYNEMIEKRNAEQARVGAQWAGIVGGIETQEALRQFHKFQGLVRASQSKSMVQVNTGTAKLVQLENAREADQEVAARDAQTSAQVLQQLELRNQALIRAQTQRLYAQIYLETGRLKKKAAITGALLGAGKTAASWQGWGNP
jgi:ABC-type Na+ efflux pump permease subunit